MKKVLILSTFRKPGGGPQGYTYNLEKGLAGKNHPFIFWSTFILSDRIKPISKLDKFKSSPVFFKEFLIFFSYIKINIKTFVNFSLLCKVIKSRTIVVNDQSYLFIMLVSRIIGKKVYYMQHTPTPWKEEILTTLEGQSSFLFNITYSLIERAHFLLAHVCILPSENSVNCYDSFNGVSKKYILGKAIFLLSGAPRLNEKLQIKERSILKIGFFGRFHEHKGFDIFLRIVESLVDNKGIHFFCAGSGNINVPILENLTNLGWIEDMATAISSVDIVLCPNRFTYFDLLPLEVLSIGRILILSDSGGNIDLSAMTNGVFIAECENIQDYKLKILEIKNEFTQDKINSLEMNNKNVYKDFFSLDAFASRYIDYFSIK